MKKRTLVLATACLFSGWFAIGQSITIDQTQTPAQLVNNVLVGSGVVVSNIEFNYSVPLANALQTQCGYFTSGTSTFPLAEGFIMGTGNMIMALGPNNATSSTNNTGVAADPNDPDLDAISTAVMNDEAVLEFDFVPDGDSVVFNYIFASEEYPEYSPSTFNDAFGFFISGPGISGTFS